MRAIGLCVAAQGEMPPGDVAAQGGGAKVAWSSTELGEHIPCGLTFTHPYPYPLTWESSGKLPRSVFLIFHFG